MPMYTYNCPSHGTTTRIVRYDDRDAQFCDVETEVPDITAVSLTEAGMQLDGHVTKARCGRPLIRDEIETSAFTPYSWKP